MSVIAVVCHARVIHCIIFYILVCICIHHGVERRNCLSVMHPCCLAEATQKDIQESFLSKWTSEALNDEYGFQR